MFIHHMRYFLWAIFSVSTPAVAIEVFVILEGLSMRTGVEVAEARALIVSAPPEIGAIPEGDAWVTPGAGLLPPEGE